MRRHRFLVGSLPGAGDTLRLAGPENDHLVRVLRLREGQEAYLFDGRGHEVRARLQWVDRRESILQVEDHLNDLVDSPLQTLLLQSLAAGDRVDQVVRRATELGVSRILLLDAEHTASTGRRPPDSRLSRWRRIAREAGKQCGRRVIPPVEGPVSPDDWPAPPGGGPGLLLDPSAGTSLLETLTRRAPPEGMALAVGPEGGWSETDRRAAGLAGYHTVRLGPRVLRTEAAGPAALALVQAVWGDL